MRVFMFFNVFTTRSGQMGHGHARVTLDEGRVLTEEVVLEVEGMLRRQEGYLTLVTTNIVRLDA